MDNLTHTLIGVALGRAGLTQRFGPGTTAVLAIASNLPDVDAVLIPCGPWDGFLMRRCFTHCVIGAPLLALVAALIEKRVWKHFSVPVLFGLNMLGIVLHVLFDLFNSYGVRILYPFSDARFELAWVFIIDLALWAMLLAPLLLWKLSERAQLRGWRAALVLAALYVGLCARNHDRAEAMLAASEAARGAERLKVFPEALGPHRFRGAVRKGQEWTLYRVQLASGRCEPFRTFRTADDDPRVKRLLAENADVKRLDWFFAAPVWEPKGPDRWRYFDLRFVSTVLTGRAPAFMFEIDAEGRRSAMTYVPPLESPGGAR